MNSATRPRFRPAPRRGVGSAKQRVSRSREDDDEQCNTPALPAGFPKGSRKRQQTSTSAMKSAEKFTLGDLQECHASAPASCLVSFAREVGARELCERCCHRQREDIV